MRIAIILALAGGLATTACSRERAAQVSEGAQAAAGHIKDAAATIKSDPDVQEAGTAIKESVAEDGQAAKQVALAAGDAAKDAAAKAKDAAAVAAEKTKAAAAETKAKTDQADTAVNPRR